MKKREIILAEYISVKDELINIFNNQNTLFIFAFTSVGAVLSYALQTNNAYITFIPFVILLCFKCRLIYYRHAYFRKLAYIRIFLEPKLNIDSSVQRVLKESRISKIQYFSFSFMGIGSILAYNLIGSKCVWEEVLTIIFLVIIICLDCYYVGSSKPLYESLEKQYIEKCEKDKKINN